MPKKNAVKRAEAEARQAERNKRTPAQQIKRLDKREATATRERGRLGQ